MNQFLAIAVGGACGALLRYGIAVWTASAILRFRDGAPVVFPWGTFAANMLGAFLMGLLYQLFSDRLIGQESLRLMVTTGFLGALTTFSTFALEGFNLFQAGGAQPALFYMITSNLLGLLLVWIGMQTATLL